MSNRERAGREKPRRALPSREQLVAFIQSAEGNPATKEIAKAFHLKGDDRRWLRQELKALSSEGLVLKDLATHQSSRSQLTTHMLASHWILKVKILIFR